jgi:FkbM family methyltransferase
MHSQNNEEAVILDYFKGKIGRFIDIGANDGITFSNTRALAELGWCGVFLEPSPKAFHKLKQLYSDSKKGCFYMYQAAISTKNGKIDLFESGTLLGNGDVGLVSTLHEQETERFKKKVPYEKIVVDCFRWKTFLNRLYIKEFDFISIDIEGSEIEVLKQMDLSKTQLICVETNGDLQKKTVLDEMLKDFKVIYTSPENLIYAR